jgi:2'-5' RNA ligase
MVSRVTVTNSIMNEQLSLLEIPPAPIRRYSGPVHKYCLFLAIFPDRCTAQRIIAFANMFRQKQRMHGKIRPLNHLHVSLCPIGRTLNVPETVAGTVVDDVCKAVAKVTSPFEINFDWVTSFGGPPGNRPIVLFDNNRGNEGVRRLYELLHAGFAKCDPLNSENSKFSPHVTFLYGNRELAPVPIEPVRWTAKEVVLVCSETGATKYLLLHRWELGQ